MVFNRAITLLLLAHFSSSYAFTSDSLKVKIGHRGVLVGRHYVTINGRHMRAFMGIPYAQPPVEGLRFKVIRFDLLDMLQDYIYIFLATRCFS